jgi:hypothetical protein
MDPPAPPPKKILWADIDDDEPIETPKKTVSYVPPHQRREPKIKNPPPKK